MFDDSKENSSTAAVGDDIAAAAQLAASSTNKKQLISRLALLLKASRYVLLMFLFAFGIRTALSTFLNRNQFSSDITNTLCSETNTANQMLSLMKTKGNITTEYGSVWRKPLSIYSLKHQQQLRDEAGICELPSNQQFKKFVWLLTDGLPVKYSQKTLNFYRDHSVLYTIDIPGPKYSHAIYTSYLTGQLPTNYQGSPIVGDSLIKSMQRSPAVGPLTYIGPEWSFLAISGKNNYRHLFKRIINKPEPLDQPHDRAYRFFFMDQPSKDWMWSTLESIKAEGGSILTHSAIFDHINHGIFRNNPTNTKYLDFLANRIADDINTLKAWIDKNPEYLLILSSDHGCDDVSNGYVLHGYSTNGNEGYVMLYNPALTPHSQRVDVVDISPTIAKYLDKVDIPADNIGVSRVDFGKGEDAKRYKANALKQNIIQMADTSLRRGIGGINYEQISNLMKMKVETGGAFKNYDEFNAKLLEIAGNMKGQLYKLLNKPYHWVAYYAVQSFVVIVVLLYKYSYNSLLLMAKGYIIKGVFLLLPLFPMYFGLFINVLFVWDSWKGIIRSGGPFYIWHGFLAIVIFYMFFRVAVSIDDVHRRKLLAAGKKFLYHTLMDMTLFGLFTLFRKQWKWTFDDPWFFYIPYAMLFIFLLNSANVSITSLLLVPFRLVRRILKRPLNNAPSRNKQDIFHLVVSMLLFVVLVLFERTSVKSTADRDAKAKYISYYSFFGFHIYYAAFMIMNAIYFVITLLINTNDIDRVLVPATLYAFAIMRDTPHGRVLTLSSNFGYLLFLVPLIQRVNTLAAYHRRDKRKKLAQQQEKTVVYSISTAHAFDMLQQALALFLLNEPLFQFVVGKEEKLNVDAHPFAGAIGMRSHQEYPSFNAFQMAFEKWHPILLFALFTWKIIHKTSAPQQNQPTSTDRKILKHSVAEHEEQVTYDADLLLTLQVLMLFNANAFLQLMLCFIGMNHPFEDSVVYLIVVSVMGATFCAFHLLTQYFSLRKLLVWCLRKTGAFSSNVKSLEKLERPISSSRQENILPLDDFTPKSPVSATGLQPRIAKDPSKDN